MALNSTISPSNTKTNLSMRTFIATLAICVALFSCSKEINLPPQSQSAATVSNSGEKLHPQVSFKVSTPQTIYLSQVRNTIQSDSFFVSEGNVHLSKMSFKLTGSPNLVNPGFYVNGGQVKTIITYSNDSIFVEIRKPITFAPGGYNYILQAKTIGESGATFSISLVSAVIKDDKGRKVEVLNLPQVGNDFILN